MLRVDCQGPPLGGLFLLLQRVEEFYAPERRRVVTGAFVTSGIIPCRCEERCGLPRAASLLRLPLRVFHWGGGGTYRAEHVSKGGQCPVLVVCMCNAKKLRKEELSVRGELENL